MIGVTDEEYALKYFAEFGFTVVDSGSVTATNAQNLYNVNSALKSIRLQNGHIDSHRFLRILVGNNHWDRVLDMQDLKQSVNEWRL